MNLIKKNKLSLTFILTFLILNIQALEKKPENQWSERNDLWTVIPDTKWNFTIQNQVKDDTILTLTIIEDKDLNSTKKPTINLEASSNQTKSIVNEINLPASYHIQVERKSDKCKWLFTPGSLLRTSENFTFLNHNPECGIASGDFKLDYNKDTKTGELLFVLKEAEEKPLKN